MKQPKSDDRDLIAEVATTRHDSRVSRRRLLQFAGIGLAAPLLTDCKSSDEEEIPPEVLTPGDVFFPQSLASGDPRPDSVVLWTRVVDGTSTADLPLTLTIAHDAAFADVVASQALLATAAHDHVIKLRVSGLTPATVYYYRFVYQQGATKFVSHTGRTKTAPLAASDVPVKFAFVSCQDFIGRYYNSYAKMLELIDELDFVVHLGDYIYETNGDPNFQASPGARDVEFTDLAGAIAFKNSAGTTTHYGAQSLSNYRDLYKTYRTDPYLQQVHEKVPFLCIWDDHEFSDDCYGDNATYFDGKVDESAETARRKAAEQAYFEYQPCEFGLDAGGALSVDDAHVPVADQNVFIYRDFVFGKHLHLVLSDTRSYRPDHLIAEDAFFGTIVATEAELTAAGENPLAVDGNNNPLWAAYVNIDDAAYAAHKAAALTDLTALYQAAATNLSAPEAAARAAQALTGNVSVAALNAILVAEINANPPTLTAIDPTGEPRGMSVDTLRFQSERLFANDGINARYLVNKRTYDVFAKVRFAQTPASQELFSAAQDTWIKDTLTASTSTWKVLGSSISFSSMVIDMRASSFPPSLLGLPDTTQIQTGAATFAGLLPEPYYFSVDQWDGFPNKRDQVLDFLRGIDNAIVISGDIHSSYVSNHGKGSGGAHNVFEFTGTGISSESFKGFTREKVDAVVPGASSSPNIAAVIAHLEEFLKHSEPKMLYAANDTNGFVTLAVDGTKLTAQYYEAPEPHAFDAANDDPVAAAAPFQVHTWTVQNNTITEG